MKPFLRSTDRGRLAPVGWVSEPAGRWADKEHDIVYDPKRHDVMFLRADPGQEAKDGFSQAGYRRLSSDGPCELWVRDRAPAVDAALARIDRTATRARSAELGGPSW